MKIWLQMEDKAIEKIFKMTPKEFEQWLLQRVNENMSELYYHINGFKYPIITIKKEKDERKTD